ncbi:GPW/gp25 family protein [Pseudarthrobacter sp. NIBRBAC000502772]|uniref:GPW/gp25 family protein n=1 Tax=Pseudarthrobacter sp. NIBRBAC000502772 TaxID=2590775 RepID=UPI001131E04E|nr:GPW/gp25 family protein [Pseudarthrobacter sp. NIBRBAC000502772]QDG66675.1 GPW/gp25 family protein [Pseudarthrobacter sp. NIBRBAC000502772]
MSVNDYPQVGRGWAFPPRWRRSGHGGPGDGVLEANDGADHVMEAMIILLRTMRGSRVMRPGLGAGVDGYVFEPRTPDACYRLADDVRRALVLGEPRVIVDAVEAVAAGDADDRVDVTIEFRIDRHRRPNSLVVPFYLAGTS